MLAKICGVSVLLLLLVALRQWFALARTSNNRVERIQLSTNDIFLLQQLLPSFKKWSSADQRVFTDQLGLFLAEVKFQGAWDPKMQFATGISITLATWDVGYINKQDWVLCLQEGDSFHMERFPEIKMQIPTLPIVNISLKEVLEIESIVALKNAISVNF